MWNSLNILSHKISLIFIEYFLTVVWQKLSCRRFHQLFHSVSLQNIRLACSSRLGDQPAFTGESTECFVRCYIWKQNLHAVCREANVRKEQTFQQKVMSRKLQVMKAKPEHRLQNVTVLLATRHQQSASCDSAVSYTTPAVRVLWQCC